MRAIDQVCQKLAERPRTWLVTGAAGFIGSHLIEVLLRLGQTVDVACGERTTLSELFRLIRAEVEKLNPSNATAEPLYREFRSGDIRHSLADVSKARRLLGYAPSHSVMDGLREAAGWYAARLRR